MHFHHWLRWSKALFMFFLSLNNNTNSFCHISNNFDKHNCVLKHIFRVLERSRKICFSNKFRKTKADKGTLEKWNTIVRTNGFRSNLQSPPRSSQSSSQSLQSSSQSSWSSSRSSQSSSRLPYRLSGGGGACDLRHGVRQAEPSGATCIFLTFIIPSVNVNFFCIVRIRSNCKQQCFVNYHLLPYHIFIK